MRIVRWVGSSRDDLRAFPDDVRDEMGKALYQAQQGLHPKNAKPLKGFGGAAVVEIVVDYVGDTYRAVYTVKLPDAIYVLHAFQKKSTRGIATSRRDLDTITQRLKMARFESARTGDLQ